jgi:hypothetical protein
MTIAPANLSVTPGGLRKKRFNNCSAARRLGGSFIDIIDA